MRISFERREGYLSAKAMAIRQRRLCAIRTLDLVSNYQFRVILPNAAYISSTSWR